MVMKIETAEQHGRNLNLLPWLCLGTQEERDIYSGSIQNRPVPYNRVACLITEDLLMLLGETRLEASIGCYALLDGKQ